MINTELKSPTSGWCIGDRARNVDTNELGSVVEVRWADIVLNVNGKRIIFPVRFLEKVE